MLPLLVGNRQKVKVNIWEESLILVSGGHCPSSIVRCKDLDLDVFTKCQICRVVAQHLAHNVECQFCPCSVPLVCHNVDCSVTIWTVVSQYGL